ncbi:malate synthase A [bacterium]|jgi:malate synthase|nr:malate synthase A [bacterium]
MNQALSGLHIRGAINPGFEEILTPDALEFIRDLEQRFGSRRRELIQKRIQKQGELNNGVMPEFLEETASVRSSQWKVRPAPKDLVDRRVEITGPTERKMVINALNSGAKVFMADFEDANSPTWEVCIEGQLNLRDAIRRTISFQAPGGKEYNLKDEVATLLVRPRGWHMVEKHLVLDGNPVSASFVDFGLYFFHNAKKALEIGSGPYFYLPKLEGHLEARLWEDVLSFSEQAVGIEHGSTRVTVLIETILGAFEMDEILYELRDHIVGLNCGRWDYIFSFIKRFQKHPEFILPDRSEVTMTSHFLRSYSLLLIQTCHKRGAHAMGGMAAQVPIKGDPEANEAALSKVRADKEREAGDGHDGTWVAHPALVPIATEIFDKHMPQPNQLDKLREDVSMEAADLLKPATGQITAGGIQNNVSAALRYMASWLSGQGCVAIRHLMEDAATAEIARAQLWQWLHFPGGVLGDGTRITVEMIDAEIDKELGLIRNEVGENAFENGNFVKAAELFRKIVVQDEFSEFLTLEAYEHLV